MVEGIVVECRMLVLVCVIVDLIIDMLILLVGGLRDSIECVFGGDGGVIISVIVEFFGFKYGLLMDVDMVMDVWFLLNLYWVDELWLLIG